MLVSILLNDASRVNRKPHHPQGFNCFRGFLVRMFYTNREQFGNWSNARGVRTFLY